MKMMKNCNCNNCDCEEAKETTITMMMTKLKQRSVVGSSSCTSSSSAFAHLHLHHPRLPLGRRRRLHLIQGLTLAMAVVVLTIGACQASPHSKGPVHLPTLPATTMKASSISSGSSDDIPSRESPSLTSTTTLESGAQAQVDVKDVEEEEVQAPLTAAVAVVPFPKYKFHATSCNSAQGELGLNITFDSRFNGRIYASDYADDVSCGVNTLKGKGGTTINFSLPLGQCGVQMQSQDELDETTFLRYDAVLYIQYSAYVQQAADLKVAVTCLEVRKAAPVETEVDQALNQEITSVSVASPGGSSRGTSRRSRQGRRLSMLNTMPVSQIGEALMEIINGKDPSPKTKKVAPLFVGEDVTLVVSTKVTRGYDARVVNCTVHDGSPKTDDGTRSQQIVDSIGCSTDLNLVPNFRRRRLPIESRNKLITLHFSSFPAFKFPEREHVHVRCAVAYCHGPCPQEVCDGGNHYGSWKDKYGSRIAGVLQGTVEVSNSMQVLAPNLDGGGKPPAAASVVPAGHNSPAISAPIPPVPPREHHDFLETGRSFPSSGAILPAPAASMYHHNHYTGAPSAPLQQSAPMSGPGAQQQYNYNTQSQPHSNTLTMSPQALSSVCISPATLILIFIILGLVLVIAACATLWLALRRNEIRKYGKRSASAANTFSSYASSSSTGSPSPTPYYRFSHW